MVHDSVGVNVCLYPRESFLFYACFLTQKEERRQQHAVKETEFLRLKRTRLGVEDFELLKGIGACRGQDKNSSSIANAFGLVLPLINFIIVEMDSARVTEFTKKPQSGHFKMHRWKLCHRMHGTWAQSRLPRGCSCLGQIFWS